MKSKAPLPLMEQLVMILVFALAATLCVQGFFLAGRLSRHQEARSEAVVFAQNAAELLKHTHGDYEQTAQILGGTWDGHDLTVSLGQSRLLQAFPIKTESPLLGSAHIQILEADMVLFEITVAWQEVTGDVDP